MNNYVFGIGNGFKTPDGKSFADESQANEHCAKERARLSAIARREITDSEWRQQQIAPAIDSRTTTQKMSQFSVRVKDALSPLEKQIAQAEADVAAQQSKRERAGMTTAESTLLTLKQRQQREQQAAENERVRAIHAKAVAPTLQTLDQLIEKEKWSTESDAAFRQELAQARETLLHPQHDPGDLRERLQAIDSVLMERKTLRQAELLERKAELEATLAEVELEAGILSQSESKGEYTPDPYGYEKVEDNTTGIRPDQKVFVNRNQRPISLAVDLANAMEAAGFGEDSISEVRQAALSGDAEAFAAVVDKFAE